MFGSKGKEHEQTRHIGEKGPLEKSIQRGAGFGFLSYTGAEGPSFPFQKSVCNVCVFATATLAPKDFVLVFTVLLPHIACRY